MQKVAIVLSSSSPRRILTIFLMTFLGKTLHRLALYVYYLLLERARRLTLRRGVLDWWQTCVEITCLCRRLLKARCVTRRVFFTSTCLFFYLLYALFFVSIKSRLVLTFWYRLTQIVPDKWSLDGVDVVVVHFVIVWVFIVIFDR